MLTIGIQLWQNATPPIERRLLENLIYGSGPTPARSLQAKEMLRPVSPVPLLAPPLVSWAV